MTTFNPEKPIQARVSLSMRIDQKSHALLCELADLHETNHRATIEALLKTYAPVLIREGNRQK